MKVGRFTLKDRITLDIMGQCDAALQIAKNSTVEKEAVLCLKRIVRLLCTKWSSFIVFKRDLHRVDKILIAAGFNAEKSDAEYDPNWLVNLTSWIAVHLGGKLPYEVATGSTAKEAERVAKDIGKKYVNDYIKFWRIQHDPEDVLHDLNKELIALADSESEEIAARENKSTTKPKIPSMAQLIRNAYRA